MKLQKFSKETCQKMTDSNHLNNLFFPANQSDLNYEMQDDNDQDNSFPIARMKPENWENLNDNDCEQSHHLIGACHYEYDQRKNNSNEYVQHYNNGLIEYLEAKKNQKPMIAVQQPTILNQDEQDYKSSKQKMKRGKSRYSRQRQKSPAKQQKQLRNLKSISRDVCQYVQNAQHITYSQLFKKFIDQQEKDAKNLRRRMYDVINVLCASEIIIKMDVGFGRCNKNTKIKRKTWFQINSDKREQQIIELKQKYEQKEKNLSQKKRQLSQLKKKRANLLKLLQRNKQISKDQQHKDYQKHEEDQKIMFPLHLYEHMPDQKFIVNKQSIKIIKNSVQSSQMTQEAEPKVNKKIEIYPILDKLNWVKGYIKHKKLRKTKIIQRIHPKTRIGGVAKKRRRV